MSYRLPRGPLSLPACLHARPQTNIDRNPRSGYLQPNNQEPGSLLARTKASSRSGQGWLCLMLLGGRAARGAAQLWLLGLKG